MEDIANVDDPEIEVTETVAVKSSVFGEDIDQAFSEIDQLIESWNHRLSFSNLALAERYLNGNLRIVVDFTDRGGKDYRAVLQRELPILRSERNTQSLGSRAARECGSVEFDGNTCITGSYRYDHLVFVENIKLVDEKERFSPVPSLVWLEPLEKADTGRADSLYASQTIGFKFLAGVAERKTCFPSDLLAVSSDQITNEQVQSRSEIVDGVTDVATPHKREGFDAGNAPTALSGLGVILSNESYWVGFDKTAEVRAKLLDMLFGPFNLQSGADERVAC